MPLIFKRWIISISILGIILAIFPVLKGNIYFTVDQGTTSLYVREIVEHGRFFLKGPETSIRGVFAGPLWYYFQAIGYFTFSGNPLGGIFVLALLKITTLAWFTIWISKRIEWKWGLLIFIAQQIYWPTYISSLWAFNPFPIVPLSLIFIAFLTNFLQGNRKFFFYSLFIVLLSLNTDLAGAAIFMIFLAVAGLIGLKEKIISSKDYFLGALFVPLLGIAGVMKQFLSIFLKTKVFDYQARGIGVFTGTNFQTVAYEFLKIFGATILPQNIIVGALIFTSIIIIYFKLKKVERASQKFTYLTFGIFVLSFFFFSSNRGWKDWHTVYLAPLLFTSVFIMLSQIPRKISIYLVSFIILFQSLYFAQNIKDYLKPSDNPSILYNQTKTIDWIYEKSESQGFAVYNYTDRFFDNTYQYLFWWYGLKKYQYLPCEYANYPLSAKELYVPGSTKYLEPKRGCDRIKFLIIESETNGETNKDWIIKFREHHTKVDSTNVGKIKIEKYYINPGKPDDFCIWWNKCN